MAEIARKIHSELLWHIQALEATEYVRRVRARLRVMDVLGDGEFIRVGGLHDGGYILWDDFRDTRIAYSIGIDGDVSWDMGMARRGIAVYQYDHTIEAPKETCPAFHFFRIGLAGVPAEGRPELETLAGMIARNGHGRERNMVLKMDIEGSELDVLRTVDAGTLRQFSQIVVEFHGLCSAKHENELLFGLDKLNATHQLVHVHANNHGVTAVRDGLVLPDVLEGTYLLRGKYRFAPCSRFFPTWLDAPNNPTKEDIPLGYWG